MNKPRRKPKKIHVTALGSYPVKSGFEKKVADTLTKAGIDYIYETGLTVKYTVPASVRKYTPDFQLDGHSWVLESKGRFTSADRQKLLFVKASNPDLDVRLLFQRDNPLYKGSKTLYSQWATKNGFKWAVGVEVPQAWLSE